MGWLFIILFVTIILIPLLAFGLIFATSLIVGFKTVKWFQSRSQKEKPYIDNNGYQIIQVDNKFQPVPVKEKVCLTPQENKTWQNIVNNANN